jgi:aminomethyltransferase
MLQRGRKVLAPAARAFGSSTHAAPLLKTPLYDLHVELKGKMVPFAGYEMAVQYPDGVLASHLHCRAPDAVSVFDVSHMGQIR